MDFGTSIHGALEKFKNPKLKISLETTVWYFEVMWRSTYSGSIEYELEMFNKLPEPRPQHKAPLTDKEVDEWVLVGEKIIRNLFRLKELEEARVLFVEHNLMEEIDRTDGIKTKFKGFIDIVIKTKDKRGKSVVYICDYKTCSWGWPLEKKRDEKLQMQLRLYKHFFCKQFKLEPKQVRCAFILLKRRPNGDDVADWLAVSAGPKTVLRAVNNLNSAITGMNSDNYKKNRSACINEYDDVCPYYKHTHCPKD